MEKPTETPNTPIVPNTPTIPTTPPTVPPATPPVAPPVTPPTAPVTPEQPEDIGEPDKREVRKIDVKIDDEEVDLLDNEKAKGFIKKAVEDNLNPVNDRIEDQKIQTELNDIFVKFPEYKEYEARIRKWVNHENRKGFIKNGLPVIAVVNEAVAPYLQEIGAKKARAADEEARKRSNPGTPPVPTQPQKIDYSKMSPEEITKLNEDVKSGRVKLK